MNIIERETRWENLKRSYDYKNEILKDVEIDLRLTREKIDENLLLFKDLEKKELELKLTIEFCKIEKEMLKKEMNSIEDEINFLTR